MKAAFEKLDGTVSVQNVPSVKEGSDIILTPARAGIGGEVIGYFRYDLTKERCDDLPLYRQSRQPLDGFPYPLLTTPPAVSINSANPTS
jgi:hypothetical protein